MIKVTDFLGGEWTFKFLGYCSKGKRDSSVPWNFEMKLLVLDRPEGTLLGYHWIPVPVFTEWWES